MTFEIELTDNQVTGLTANATHNGKDIAEYVAWRIQQDADRGYNDYLKSTLASIQEKLLATPSILADVEAVVDVKKAEVEEAARAALEAAMAEELVKEE